MAGQHEVQQPQPSRVLQDIEPLRTLTLPNMYTINEESLKHVSIQKAGSQNPKYHQVARYVHQIVPKLHYRRTRSIDHGQSPHRISKHIICC